MSLEQCYMARLRLRWSRTELFRRSSLESTTIAAFEKGISKLFPRTVPDLKADRESADVTFFERRPV